MPPSITRPPKAKPFRWAVLITARSRRLAAIGWAFAAVVAAPLAAHAEQAKPNFIFVIADDQRMGR